MKKIIAILVAVLLVASMSVCFAEEGRTFIHGFDAEYKPFSYMGDDGEYTGFDVELCKAVCELKGWTYEGFAVNWDTKDQELYAGACDCVWSGFTINGREDEYAWSVPYVDNLQVILTRTDTGIAGPDDLAGRIVGVQAGTSALEMLQEGGDCYELACTFGDLLQFNSYLSAFTDLQAGAIEAIVIDIGVAQSFVVDYGEEFVICEGSIGSEKYGVGFRLEDTELRDEVNDALMQLTKDGTVAALAEKYELADCVCLIAE